MAKRRIRFAQINLTCYMKDRERTKDRKKHADKT